SGDGGFVETSSHGQLAFTGNVDTSAPRGKAGTLLLDSEDIHIVSNCDGTCPQSTILAAQINALLSNQNVVIATNLNLAGNGDISVQTIGAGPNDQINWSNSNSLTLSAYHDITFFDGSKITNTGAGALVLRADSTGTGSGTVSFQGTGVPGRVDFSQTSGAVSIYYNPSPPQTFPGTKYQNPTNFTTNVLVQQPSQLTAYMLVNNASDLQAVSTNLAGTYALGRSFSAAGFTGFTPGTIFTGLFDGNGGLGVNYTISDLTLAPANSPVALFPFIESGATVRSLNLANVNVAATGSLMFVAPLAGENRGTISNVQVLSGTVSGGSQSGAAGGLVAQNKGLIENSSSAANVSVGSNGTGGGLVGFNLGIIQNAFASGSVTGAAGTNGLNSQGGSTTLGGLAGINQGLISGSSAA